MYLYVMSQRVRVSLLQCEDCVLSWSAINTVKAKEASLPSDVSARSTIRHQQIFQIT
jgi:hypothetical protein